MRPHSTICLPSVCKVSASKSPRVNFSIRSASILLALLCLGAPTFVAPADAADAPQATSNPPETTLYGGVSHSDALPHVDHQLSLHRKSIQPLEITRAASASQNTSSTPATNQPDQSKQKLGYIPMAGIAQPVSDSTKSLSGQVQKYKAEWFMIPPWLAGHWVKQGDLTVSLTDLRTGAQSFPNEWIDNKMEAFWGHQKDAAGNVWHVNFLPSERDGQSDGKGVRFLTIKQNCEKTDEQMLVTRTQYIVSESNFWTGQSIDMFQQESLNHYVQGSDQILVNNSTNRVFTYEGTPVRDGHLRTQYTKLGGFVAMPILNGIDLKASLNDYLDEHGLSNLKVQ